ncbi:hypothetical protein [Phenylobacterium deserti]|uniref:Uncharacterized protein n=1 Tax=Phenylobacterium deserti TaxID=1914756 RepID=A0A328ADK1_9CAUL|nr:hypothetical protein [Phenylobacterium deserti]RAK51484.1 hypothetical protein DJ018_16250 [Phenylobacterium deserti]
MMNQYRIYVLNRQDRIADALEEDLPNDRRALERAEALSAGQYAAEVWDGERLVGRLGGELRLG